jgi:hypothetical protein
MRPRYAGVCRACGIALPAKSEAIYERASKTVRCVNHVGAQVVASEGEDAGRGQRAPRVGTLIEAQAAGGSPPWGRRLPRAASVIAARPARWATRASPAPVF